MSSPMFSVLESSLFQPLYLWTERVLHNKLSQAIERRNLAKDNKEYIAFVEEYINEMETLNINLENEILSELNLDASLYKKSSQQYIAEKNVEYLTKLSELTVVTRYNFLIPSSKNRDATTNSSHSIRRRPP